MAFKGSVDMMAIIFTHLNMLSQSTLKENNNSNSVKGMWQPELTCR